MHEQKKEPKKQLPDKKKGKLSDRDLAFLMRSNMKTLKRGKGGAYK